MSCCSLYTDRTQTPTWNEQTKQLQEARERIACLEAQQARLEAAADQGEAERGYLAAERRLVTAQLRRLGLLLVAQRAAPAAEADSDAAAAASAARAESKAAEAQAEEAWARLPAGSRLRVLGGPAERLREVRGVGREAAQLLAERQARLAEAQQDAAAADRRARASEARCARLAARLRAVAEAAAAHAAEVEGRCAAAGRERDAAGEREAQLQRSVERMVSGLMENNCQAVSSLSLSLFCDAPRPHAQSHNSQNRAGRGPRGRRAGVAAAPVRGGL